MGMLVCGGAMLQCVFGSAPAVFNVLPQAKVMNVMAAANIMDNKPMANIMPFLMCSSPANPTVAAATAAALGVLTPMPCIPVIPAPWVPGSPTVLIGGQPAVNDSSQLICAYGGVISVKSPGQTTINVP